MKYQSLIESLGVYLPENNYSTRELIQGCAFQPEIDLEKLTGIENRAIADKGEYALDLAKKATEKCFSISRHTPQDMDMVICANICRYNGPNFKVNYEPSSSSVICREFQIDNAIVFDISNACASMFSAIEVMNAYIRAGIIKKGLIVSGEYISHLAETAQKEIENSVDPQFASLTVGDSGAAIILESTEDQSIGFKDTNFFTAAEHCDLCIAHPSKQGNSGYVMQTNSSRIHTEGIRLSSHHLTNLVSEWNTGFDHFIMHQTADKAIRNMSKKLDNFTPEDFSFQDKAIINVQERGNTASTSHFVALWDKIKSGTINSHEKIVFGIQASGINVGAALYSLDDLPQRILETEMDDLKLANVVNA